MSCLNSSREVDLTKKTNINNLILIKFLQKTKTQHQTTFVANNPPIPQQLPNHISFNQKKSDFPSIFCKHKRNQYSGYKQIYVNKSKAIIFQTDHKQINRYHTQRKYELNIKNIAKLRKKYSLQPIFRKNSVKDNQFNQSAIVTTKNTSSHQIKLEQVQSTQKTKSNNDAMSYARNNRIFTQENCRYETQNIQKQQEPIFQIKKSHTERSVHILSIAEKIQPLQIKNNSKKSSFYNQEPFCLNLKKKFQKRMPKFKQKTQQNDTQKHGCEVYNTRKHRCETQILEQSELCGWENDSFYGKNLQKIIQCQK